MFTRCIFSLVCVLLPLAFSQSMNDQNKPQQRNTVLQDLLILTRQSEKPIFAVRETTTTPRVTSTTESSIHTKTNHIQNTTLDYQMEDKLLGKIYKQTNEMFGRNTAQYGVDMRGKVDHMRKAVTRLQQLMMRFRVLVNTTAPPSVEEDLYVAPAYDTPIGKSTANEIIEMSCTPDVWISGNIEQSLMFAFPETLSPEDLVTTMLNLNFRGADDQAKERVTVIVSVNKRTQGVKKIRPFSHLRVSASEDRVISLDITKIVLRWLNNPSKNRGLTVTVHTAMGESINPNKYFQLPPPCATMPQGWPQNRNNQQFENPPVYLSMNVTAI